MPQENIKCALVLEVYQKSQLEEQELLISACADRFLLSSKREPRLLHDRRRLLLPHTAVAHMKAFISLTEVSVCRLLYTHSHILITPLVLDEINSLANSHSER